MNAKFWSDDFRLINLLLSALPYPLSKADFIKELQAICDDEATIAWFTRLPHTTFNSALEVRSLLLLREG